MKLLSTQLSLVGFLATCLLLSIWDVPTEYLQNLLHGGTILSYAVYVILLTSAVVFMPLTVMPVIPVATSVLGPLPTALLSIVGWTLGSVIAFLISRYAARPVLAKFVSFEKLDAFASSIPERAHFWIIVLIRLTMPVDIASYALGLSKHIRLTEYTLATALGVTWFSFAFAYLGDALLTGNMPLLIQVASASTLVFLGGWYLLQKSLK